MKDNKVVLRLLIVVLVAIIAFVIITIFPNPNEEETETIYCGANNSMPTKVFKNPTKAFPTFAQNFNNKIDGVTEIMDSLSKKPKTTISISLNSQVVELREKLNQENTRMEMIMKSNFFAFNANPCDPEIRKSYYNLLNVIVEKNSSLENLRAQLTVALSKGGTVKPEFRIIADTSKIKSSILKFEENYKFRQ